MISSIPEVIDLARNSNVSGSPLPGMGFVEAILNQSGQDRSKMFRCLYRDVIGEWKSGK